MDSDAPSKWMGLTTTQWLICTIASIGFAFDIYELLMLPLVVRPALMELVGVAPGTPEFQMWVGRLFYIPAFAGGIFGLLGGYLTDRLGRRLTLVLGALVNGLGCWTFAISHDFATFLVGEVLFALGTALISAADSAMLYDSLAAEDTYPLIDVVVDGD